MKKIITTLILLNSLFCLANEKLDSILFPGIEEVNTDAVLIIKNGEVIYEKYARGYNENTKHVSWSMAKTFAGILIGQAIEENKLSLNEKVSDTLNHFKGDATILDVLQMSSGINFKEQYSGIPVDADVVKMLYLNGPKAGMGHYTSTLPLRNEIPGEHFYYSSGDTNILMEVLRKKMNKEEYNNYPWKMLFDQIEVDATFEQDAKGAFIGSSYLYMSARDFAKFGNLLVNKGEANGKQLIPSWYFNLMNIVAPGVEKNALAGTSSTDAYSMQVRTNLPIEGRNKPPKYKDLPSDSLLLFGHQGQIIVASPSEKLVIVRLATDEGHKFQYNDFYKTIKELFESKQIPMETAGATHADLYLFTEKAAASFKEEKPKFKEYLKVPKLIRTLAAKEYCSCVFITKRSKKECRKELKFSLPVKPIIATRYKKKFVRTSFTPIARTKAVYINEKLGCKLLP